MELDPQLKGALITGSGALLAFAGRLGWNYIQSLRAKIKQLKAAEQTRWEQKVDGLERTLATTNVALIEVKTEIAKLSELAATVKKLKDDITAFHIWKRVKFPEDGGGRNGEVSREPS